MQRCKSRTGIVLEDMNTRPKLNLDVSYQLHDEIVAGGTMTKLLILTGLHKFCLGEKELGDLSWWIQSLSWEHWA